MTQPPKTFWQKIADDFRAARSHLSMAAESRKLDHAKADKQRQMSVAYLDIGTIAMDSRIGTDLPAFLAADAGRTKVAQAQSVADSRKATFQSASEALAAQAAEADKQLALLDEELRPLKSEAASADHDLTAIRHQLAQNESDLKKCQNPATNEPVTGQPQRISELQQARPGLEDKLNAAQHRHNLAQAAVRTKTDQIQQARQKFDQAKAQCQGEVHTARTALSQADADLDAAKAEFSQLLGALGLAPGRPQGCGVP